ANVFAAWRFPPAGGQRCNGSAGRPAPPASGECGVPGCRVRALGGGTVTGGRPPGGPGGGRWALAFPLSQQQGGEPGAVGGRQRQQRGGEMGDGVRLMGILLVGATGGATDRGLFPKSFGGLTYV